jgi:hypothetical protein
MWTPGYQYALTAKEIRLLRQALPVFEMELPNSITQMEVETIDEKLLKMLKATED